ncbi:MAG: hypothetical protein ACFFCS_20510 [Candidatus Hodarchaeota archaeon]
MKEENWKAGLSRVIITPKKPIVLAGYDRPGVFTSIHDDIWAKAIYLQDGRGNSGVIMTMDNVGLQESILTPTCNRISALTGLKRSQLLFNASHIHTGPYISLDPNCTDHFGHPTLTPVDSQNTVEYTMDLMDKLVNLVVKAKDALEPVELFWVGDDFKGMVPFPINRRKPNENFVVMTENFDGATDRSIPVLCVRTLDGNLKCVLFSCACHNTTAVPKDNVISGDYAGFAMRYIEESSSAQAMFMSGCGADANPYPRGNLLLAELHGEELAKEVLHVVGLVDRRKELDDVDHDGESLKREWNEPGAGFQKISGSLITQHEKISVPLKVFTYQELEAVARGKDPIPALTAKKMMDTWQRLQPSIQISSEATTEGIFPTNYDMSVSTWKLGSILLIGLPSETVSEYTQFILKTLAQEGISTRDLWITGYNNEFFGYVPTKDIVKEGGHETIGITVWMFDKNKMQEIGFFTTDIQELLINQVLKQIKRNMKRS